MLQVPSIHRQDKQTVEHDCVELVLQPDRRQGAPPPTHDGARQNMPKMLRMSVSRSTTSASSRVSPAHWLLLIHISWVMYGSIKGLHRFRLYLGCCTQEMLIWLALHALLGNTSMY